MSKVVLLSTLKANSVALIHDFTGKGNDNSFRYHLIAMGFVPGRNVEVMKKTYGMFVTKVDDDSPVGIGSSAAKAIRVRLLQDDGFKETAVNKQKESFFSKFVKLLEKIKESIW